MFRARVLVPTTGSMLPGISGFLVVVLTIPPEPAAKLMIFGGIAAGNGPGWVGTWWWTRWVCMELRGPPRRAIFLARASSGSHGAMDPETDGSSVEMPAIRSGLTER